LWCSSTGASGLPRRRSGGSRWHPSQVCRTWLPPKKAIITIPITPYGYGNGDDAEEGGPERWCDGRKHGEYRRDKARRCSRLVRPLGDRKRDMLQLHPAAASLSPLARVLVQPVQVGLLLQEPWRRTRPQGLCHVSTFYTTLVKKSHQANGPSELRRTLLPCTRVNRDKRRAILMASALRRLVGEIENACAEDRSATWTESSLSAHGLRKTSTNQTTARRVTDFLGRV
jgi:hypothetical protein